jgi:2-polyprenyl-3-methyl-5-hydroxy-6-metoxy-1,4-benzoquinol methylase
MLNAPANQPAFDSSRAGAFAEQVMDLINKGSAAVMISVGHRLGLFAVLAAMRPATSAEIAGEAGLAERYVREWLAAMVTAGIILFDPKRNTYALPAEHAACLTPEGSLGNLAVYGQHVALLGEVQERLIGLFRQGGGTTYADYPCFHQIMAEDSGQSVTAPLFDHVLPLDPRIATRLRSGIDVLDAGCGRGAALIAMAARYPDSRFIGYDLGADAIDFATRVARDMGLVNIRFEQRDLTGFADKDRFDFITSFDAVHDQKDPATFIKGLHGALRPGGLYLMQDIGGSARLENNLDFPMASLLYAVSCAHCTPISLGQGGAGLGTMWGWETAERMLREAGFAQVAMHRLPHDPMNVWFVSEKS